MTIANALHRGAEQPAGMQAGTACSEPWESPVQANPVSPDEFVSTMSGAVNGVGVVTTDGAMGRYGITVSSVTSVSADPPLILACINRNSPVCDTILGNQVFGVNLLSAGQRGIADIFAGRTKERDRYNFDGVAWVTGASGAPLFRDSVAAFDCNLQHVNNAGSHTIVIGRVIMVLSTSGAPLLYSNRAYGYPCRYASDSKHSEEAMTLPLW